MSNIWCKHRRVSIGGLSWSAWLCSTCPLSSRLDLASSLGSLSTVFQNGENGSHKAFQGQHLATAVFVESIHKACSDGWPSKCPYRQGAGGWKRALQWWLCPLCATQQWHLLLWWPRLLPLDFPVCGAPYSRRCCFTATAVPSLGLLSKPHFPAPSPALYQETHNSGWGVRGSSTDHEHSSLSCRPQTSCCVPLWSRKVPFCPSGFPYWEGASLSCRNLSSPSAPHQERWSLPISSFLSFFSFFYPTQLHGKLSCPFRCPRSSTSIQQVLCENPICRCILDALVRRCEFHLRLFCHLDSSSSWVKFIPVYFILSGATVNGIILFF